MFSAEYKLAEERAGEEEEEEDEEMGENQEDIKVDAVASTVEFRAWKALARGNAVYMKILNEILQLVNEEDDEEYEEVEDDEEFKGEQSENLASALPLLKIMMSSFIPVIVSRCKAIP